MAASRQGSPAGRLARTEHATPLVQELSLHVCAFLDREDLSMNWELLVCLQRESRQDLATEVHAEIMVVRHKQSGFGDPRQGQHVRVITLHLLDINVDLAFLQRLLPAPLGMTGQAQLLEQSSSGTAAQLLGSLTSRRVRELAVTPTQPSQKRFPGRLLQFAEATSVDDDGPAHDQAIYGSSRPRYCMVSSMKNSR